MTTVELAPRTTGAPLVGERVRKHRGDRFLKGKACYLDDVAVPGALFMAVVRSTMPHARIRAVQLAAALADSPLPSGDRRPARS